MCGILCIFGKYYDIKTGKLVHRGPDKTQIKTFGQCTMEFSRLAINDTSDNGMQPFIGSSGMLVCNGEIFNHEVFPVKERVSRSDCECIMPLIEKVGIFEASKRLRGEFAFCYTDGTNVEASRDPLGVRPLFYTRFNDNGGIAFASEVKALLDFGTCINVFPPGHVYSSHTDLFECYYPYTWGIKDTFTEAVRIRVEHTDRNLGFLLSGGLDSSLVVAIANQFVKGPLKTFSVGIEDSPDVIAARTVSRYISSNHTEFRFDVEEGIKNIENVIWSLESYDTTTVRASVPMWLLSRFISQTTDCKVILSGEGSDELFGGYLYFHYAPSVEEFSEENKRRLQLIHQFDGLRADRCIAAHGLELRVPFLDVNVVESGMIIDQTLKTPKDGIEKYYLRKAFKGYLPDEILWRQKNGMSDAVGYAWVTAVKAHAENVITDAEFENIKYETEGYNVPLTKEEALYRKIFWKLFGRDKDHLISEIWRPKWTTQTDPSATKLGVFAKTPQK
jgi:asparagine synthase (glutamine-hydrolysing)